GYYKLLLPASFRICHCNLIINIKTFPFTIIVVVRCNLISNFFVKDFPIVIFLKISCRIKGGQINQQITTTEHLLDLSKTKIYVSASTEPIIMLITLITIKFFSIISFPVVVVLEAGSWFKSVEIY